MERKGQDPISVDDKSNIVFTTNNFWPVKREADDRRYSCQQVSDAKMGNKQYFDELVEELEKSETAYHLHRYPNHSLKYPIGILRRCQSQLGGKALKNTPFHPTSI
jgi:hypothetical protein